MKDYEYGVRYTLVKDNKKITFNHAREAAEYLHTNSSYISACYRNSKKCKGYTVIKNEATYHNEAHKTRLYKIWTSMNERCHGEYNIDYHNYGGRGIRVCDEWKSYTKFKEWALKNGYADNLSIDRINVNSDYEPSNCRWATWKEQANNRRNNRILIYEDHEYTLTQLAEKVDINKHTFEARLRYGWSVKDAVERPIKK